MGDSNKQICRLCLEIIPSCECTTIEEIRKEILEVLPININLDISDYAVICNMCLESIYNCIDFKSQCINTFMDVDIKVDIKKELLQGDLINHENICQENSQTCRFCKSLFDVEPLNCTADWKDEVPLKDVVRNYLPDLDLNAVQEPLICKQCLNSITRYYKFLKSCQEVEQRIERFCQVRDLCTIGRVNLKDVLTFKNCDVPINPTIIKKECPDVECDDMKCLKSIEIVNIKCEDVDIKDELDTVETCEFDQSGHYDNSGKFSKREIRNIESKGTMHVCPKCPYSTKRNALMKRHMRSHSDNKVHRCTLCSFVADATSSLRAHLTSHRGPTKAFGCHVCPYETDHKTILQKHLLKHKDKSEVEMHKCLLCPFESKYKSSLLVHRKLEHNKNIKMYKCEKCSFSTKHRVSFVGHQFLHKSPEEFPRHKCEKCHFQSRFKKYLVRHMLTHEDSETISHLKTAECPDVECDDVNVMKCSKREEIVNIICEEVDTKDELANGVETGEVDLSEDYDDSGKFSKGGIRNSESKGKMHLCPKINAPIKQHIRSHSDNKMRRCTLCSFVADTTSSLRAHLESHRGPTKAFGCRECPFETIYKVSLEKHLLKHKDNSEVEMQKCLLCPFESKYKSALLQHQKLEHSKNIKMYKCEKCSFSSKYRASLDSHQLLHKNPEEIPKYKCETCEFETRYKNQMVKHVLTHKDLEVASMFKCEKCPYQCKQQQDLLEHMMVHSNTCHSVTFSQEICHQTLQCNNVETQTIHTSKRTASGSCATTRSKPSAASRITC